MNRVGSLMRSLSLIDLNTSQSASLLRWAAGVPLGHPLYKSLQSSGMGLSRRKSGTKSTSFDGQRNHGEQIFCGFYVVVLGSVWRFCSLLMPDESV